MSETAQESSGERCAGPHSPTSYRAARTLSPYSASRPRGRVILKMSVQIPDGRKGTIHVFPGDDPKDLATNFCTKYELKDPKLQRLVERHITDSMKNLPQAHPTRLPSVVCAPRSPATDAAAELVKEVEEVRGLAAAPGQRSGRERSGRELGGSGRDSAAAAAS